MSKFLSILVVALFSLSILDTSIHHHSDHDDHSSCSLCTLLQDLSTLENLGHFETAPSHTAVVTLFITERYDADSQYYFIAKQSRSPPV